MNKNNIKKNNFFYGGFSGMAAQAITWPLEFMKTVKQFPSKYPNIFLQTIHYTKKNGVFSLYRSMFPPISMAFPRAAMRFEIYNQYEKYCNRQLSNIEMFNIGISTGILEAFIFMTPSEVLKVYNINHTGSIKNSIINIYKKRGIQGFWAGAYSTSIKQGITQGMTFLTVGNSRDYIKNNYPILSPYSGFLGGFIGGSLAVLINNPLDVIKTRQQQEAISKKSITLIKEIYYKEGLKGLYEGAIIRSIRLGILQAITFFIYDKLHMIPKINV
jgi:hypothetical protein